MSIIENIPPGTEICESAMPKDVALEAEIRAHLRFTQLIGWIMICFLSFLSSAVAYYVLQVNL